MINFAQMKFIIIINKLFLYTITFSIFFSSLPAFAEKQMTMEEMQQRILKLEEMVQKQQKIIEEYQKVTHIPKKDAAKEAKDKGDFQLIKGLRVRKTSAKKQRGKFEVKPMMPGILQIGANITALGQGSPNAKLLNDSKKEKIGGSYQANITFRHDFAGVDGFAYANMRIGQGLGVQENLTLYANVDNNAVGDDHFFFSEIYYQQYLWDKKVHLNFGKLDPTDWIDVNKYTNSDATQFISVIFNNSPLIEFPEHSLGARTAWIPYEWLQVDYLIMGTKGDLKDIESNIFHVGQVTFRPKIYDRKGNYSFLIWQNTGDHTSWDDPSSVDRRKIGLSVSMDQQITDWLGVFSKFSWTDPRVYDPNISVRAYPRSDSDPTPSMNAYSLEYMWIAGIQLEGDLWNREHDFAGIGIGQIFPSKDMKKHLKLTNLGRKARPETHFETYYNIYINKYLAITPSMELIWDAYGGDADAPDTTQVYTVRSHVDF